MVSKKNRCQTAHKRSQSCRRQVYEKEVVNKAAAWMAMPMTWASRWTVARNVLAGM
jgi:hypothetical protein